MPEPEVEVNPMPAELGPEPPTEAGPELGFVNPLAIIGTIKALHADVLAIKAVLTTVAPLIIGAATMMGKLRPAVEEILAIARGQKTP